jgi:hypothetical protein
MSAIVDAVSRRSRFSAIAETTDYYGGRAECRVRRLEVPVVHTDFTSQYPTVNALLNNWPLLTAQSVTVEDVTDDVRALVESITLDDLFRREAWPQLSFFAPVQPNDDILPVRAVYNGETQNIGINRLTRRSRSGSRAQT